MPSASRPITRAQCLPRLPRTSSSVLLLGLIALPLASHAEDPVIATVTVAAKKEAVVNKVDKTVYDVSKQPRAENGTAQDVLQATPELSVAADGQISVKGHAQVTLLVNGKPTAMLSGEDRAVALQTMSGADIASIEVMTNPSAAYQANGGAIVNIVLKRKRKPGAHAQIRGSAADQGLWNIATSADLTRGNLSIQGSLALRRDGTMKRRHSAVDWANALSGQTGQTVQTSEVFVRRKVESASLSLDYALSETDSVSLSGRYNGRRSHPLLDTLNVSRTDAVETIYHRLSVGPNQQSDGSASLAYSHLSPGSALKAMLQRSDTNGLIDKSYRDLYVTPAAAPLSTHGATRSARNLRQATVDWSRASEHGQWGMGLDLQDEVNDLDNYQASIDQLSGAETPNPATTNAYAVATTLHAAYVTEQIRHGKWEILLGGRIERMALRVGPAQSVMQTQHWQAFNPSLHTKYTLSDQADLSLSCRRSLQRPDPRDLNPFTIYVDAQNLTRGNPGLKPQLLTAWELGTNRDSAPLSSSITAFYRLSRDTVADARTFDSDNVLLTSKQNGGRARSAGITASLDWTVDAMLRLGLDGGAYRVLLFTPDLDGAIRQHGSVAYMNFRAAYSVAPDDVSLDAHLQSAGMTALGRYGATSSLNLTWKHQVDKTLSWTVNANDIFDGSRRSYRTGSSTLRQTGFDHFVARRVYVGLVKQIL